jgi:ABC-type transport system, involved in lipoprotein release, permease component
MKFLPFIWRNLLRRKIRTTFTLLSILIGFVLFGVLMAIRVAFTLGVDLAGADRLMTIHKVSLIQPLPKSYEDRIRATEGVKDVSHANWFGAYYKETSNQFANMAVDPESWLRMYPEFEVPPAQKAAWIADRTGAIVGADTARKYGWKAGDRVPLQGTIYRRPDGGPWELTIDGIYDSPVKGTDKTQLFFHWDYLNETLRQMQFGHDQVGWYVIRVGDPSQSVALARRIDALFANSSAETKTSTEKAFVSDFAKQIGDIGAIMIALVALAMFIILLVAGNTVAQSVRERTNELAVLKTLGFGDGLILTLVLAESSVLALLGATIGLGLAWLIISRGDPTNGLLPAFYFPVQDLAIGIAIAVALGLGTGLLPALQASRLKIVDALRKT